MQKKLEYAESILRSNPINAYEIAKSDEFMAEQGSQVHLEALSIQMKALWVLGRFEESIDCANLLLQLAEAVDDKSNMSKASNAIGNVYFDLSNLDKALECYMKGLALAKESKDLRTEAALLNNIGEIYKALEAYDEASSYYAHSLSLSQDIEDYTTYGVTQLNMGEVFLFEGRIQDAIDYTKVALNNFIENEDYISIANAHYNLARIYRTQNEDELAKSELLLSIDIMRRLQDRYNLSLAYVEMIEILVAEEEYEEALDYVEDAIEIAERLNAKKDLSTVALFAADIYEKLDQPKASLKFYKTYVDARFEYEKEKEEEHQKNITAQINIDKAMHEKEIYRLKNVELRKKSDEIEKLYNDMKTINQIGRDITSTLDIKKVLYLLYENINKLMDASFFGIYIFDEAKKNISMDLFLAYGRPVDYDSIDIDSKTSWGAWSIRNRRALLSNDCLDKLVIDDESYPLEQNPNHVTQSVIIVPLLLKGQSVGAITVQSTSKDAYKNYHFNMIEALASYISIAIKNSQESNRLSQEIDERIKTQSKLEILNERLSHMSYMDALTQIPNRRSFVEYLTREISRSKRLDEQLAVLIIDIDFFKEYNDNYGHVEGDKCLTTIASLLKQALKREIDFVARYGGDEFVAVMSHIDYDGAYQIAEQMKLNVKEAALEHKFSKIEDIITITIGGIVMVPGQDDTMEMVIHSADRALYDAKDKGRNQISFFSDLK